MDSDPIPQIDSEHGENPEGDVAGWSSTEGSAVSTDADEYDMTHKKRGKAIIFNHENFDNGLDHRSGTQEDERRLKQCLETLGFDVIVYQDLKLQKLNEVIKDLAQEDHTDSDCLVICVLSHGELNKIYCSDSDYTPEDLWNPFSANLCPSLAGKPKIYFIQACRGDQVDAGTQLIPKPNMRTETDSPSTDESISVVPNDPDFLVVYSTFQGYPAYRNKVTGSVFMEELCAVFEEHHRNTNVLSMLTIMNRKIAIDYQPSPKKPRKQMPHICHTLTRDLFFHSKTN